MSPPVSRHLEVIQQCLGVGNLTAADLVARLVLERMPEHPQAFNALGIIAAQIGRHDQARTYFEQASSLGLDAARGNLETLRRMPPVPVPPPETGRRFVLIKAWGHGFWSEVTHVLGGLLLAEISGRIPVVHWGDKNLFGGSSAEDGFRAFFKPVSAATIADLGDRAAIDIFPSSRTRENLPFDLPTSLPTSGFAGVAGAALNLLHRPEALVVADYHLGVIELAPWIPSGHPLSGAKTAEVFRYLIEKYLQPVDTVRRECAAFHARHLADLPSVAVHLRGGDKHLEDQEIALWNRQIMQRLAALSPQTKIFVLTDDVRYAEFLRAQYRNRLVMTDCERVSDNAGVHFGSKADGQRRGFEILRDTYIAVSAQRFIGCGSSNVSAMIGLLRDWPDDSCVLVTPSVVMLRDVRLWLHLPPEVIAYMYADGD